MLTAAVSQTNLIYLQAINAVKTSQNYYHLYLNPDELVAVRDHAILVSITSVVIYNSPCCILPDYVPQINDPNPFIQDLVIWTGKGD